MGLTIQPHVLKTLCGNKTFRGRGFSGRFLYAFPKSNIGSRGIDVEPMSLIIKDKYKEAVKGILNNKQAGKNSVRELVLSPEVIFWWGWIYAKAVERLMGKDIAYLDHITDWAGKLPGAIARIAGLLHIMRYAYDSTDEYSISEYDMSCAIKIGQCPIGHAIKVMPSRSLMKFR